MPPNGTKNLIPVRTEKEAKEKGTKGGKASGEARRKKRDLAKTFNQLLDTKVTSKAIIGNLDKLGIPTKNATLETAALAGVVAAAHKGKQTARAAAKNPRLSKSLPSLFAESTRILTAV